MKKQDIICNLMLISILCVVSITAVGFADDKSGDIFPIFAFDNYMNPGNNRAAYTYTWVHGGGPAEAWYKNVTIKEL